MKPAAANHRRSRRVFAVPGIIALVTLAGLVVGLVGDGVEDVILWLALSSCLAIITWAIMRAE